MIKETLSKEDKIKEFIKCSEDIVYFISNYILISQPGGTEINLKPYEQQKDIFNRFNDIWTKGEKDGVVLLASRQCGKTQISEAICVWLINFHSNYPVLIMSRDLSQGKETIKEITDMIDKLPIWLKSQYIAPTHSERISLSNGSYILLQASKSTSKGTSNKGRGQRPLFIWIDEAAFVPLKEHISALLPATSKSFLIAKKHNIPYGILFTSTPNGMDGMGEEFFKIWSVAIQQTELSAYYPVKIHWRDIPGYDDAWFKNQCAKLNNDSRRINQEYELQFIGSNDSFFDDNLLSILQNEKTSQEPIKIDKYPHGNVKWFDIPQNNRRYIVGIDTATSDGTDFSTVQVLDFDSLEQICSAKFKVSVTTFANLYIPNIINILPRKILAIERNSIGGQVIDILACKYEKYIVRDELSSSNINKMGITTNIVTRPLIFERIFECFSLNNECIKDKETRYEASTLKKKNGKIEGTPNDDLVMALGLILLVKEHYHSIEKYFNNGIFNNDENEYPNNDILSNLYDDDNDIIYRSKYDTNLPYNAVNNKSINIESLFPSLSIDNYRDSIYDI